MSKNVMPQNQLDVLAQGALVPGCHSHQMRLQRFRDADGWQLPGAFLGHVSNLVKRKSPPQGAAAHHPVMAGDCAVAGVVSSSSPQGGCWALQGWGAPWGAGGNLAGHLGGYLFDSCNTNSSKRYGVFLLKNFAANDALPWCGNAALAPLVNGLVCDPKVCGKAGHATAGLRGLVE